MAFDEGYEVLEFDSCLLSQDVSNFVNPAPLEIVGEFSDEHFD